MKKIISILLMTALILSGSLTFINAEEETGALNDRQKEAVSLLNDLKIFANVSEQAAKATVTRAEFAKIVVKVMGGENLPESPRRIFTDVLPENDAAASIEYLYDRGIMVGYQATFAPDDPITVEAAVKVMVSVLGYSSMAEQKMGYPNGYYTVGVSKKLLSGINRSGNDSITVADMAVIAQNVLENEDYLITSGYVSGTMEGFTVEENKSGDPYMGYALDVYKYTGILEGYGDTSLEDSSSTYKSNICKIGGELFDKGDMDLSAYLGMKVNAYYKADKSGPKILHIASHKNNDVMEIDAEDILSGTTKRVFKYEGESRSESLNISENAVFIYNGKKLDVVSDQDVISENGFVRLISNDGGSEYNVIIIKEYDTYIVDKAVVTDSIVSFKYDRGSLDLGDAGVKATYFMDGAETDFSSIANGSVLSVAMSKNLTGDILAEVLISNKQITGRAKMLENTNNKRSVILEDDSQYEFTNEFIKRLDGGQSNTYEPILGSDGTFYIDSFNKLAAYTTVTSGKNYAYVVKCSYSENDEVCYIKLFTKEGTFETLEMDEKPTVNDVKVKPEEVPDILMRTGDDNTVNQLVIYKSNSKGYVKELRTAVDKTSELAYVASGEEFVLNAFPKNSEGKPKGQRFYKNMADTIPYSFVDGQTIHFMIPTDKEKEKEYKIVTKVAAIDTSVPAPVRIYDAGPGGVIGAMTTNTASTGKYSAPSIIDKIVSAVDEDGEACTGLQFFGGTTVLLNSEVAFNQDGKGNWNTRVDYSAVSVKDLRRGDVVKYTTDSNNKVDKMQLLIRPDNPGLVRIDGDRMQESGNMIADVLSVSDNGKTAVVHFYGNGDVAGDIYQAMLVNGTVYKYESSENKIYNSTSADIRPGDLILLNSYWWSPKVVIIFR